jgi:ABC-2 type transport system permease protein
MFKEIFSFELKQWFKRPAAYIYFFLFFLIAFLIGALTAGLFGGTSRDTNTYINSATAISGLFTSFNSNFLFGFITLIVVVAIMGNAVNKDFQYNSHALFFTKPIQKSQYIFGRFLASFFVTIFCVFGVLLGLMLVHLLAPNDNGQIGPFSIRNYLMPFLIFSVINTLFLSALFFSLVTFTRNMTAGYVSSLVLIVLVGVTNSLTKDLENKTIGALLDPFGSKALRFATEYWTPAERNTNMIPLSGSLLANRLLWMGIGILLFLVTYFRFEFTQFLNPLRLFGRKPKEEKSAVSKPVISIAHILKPKQDFSTAYSWKQYIFLTNFEFMKFVKSVFFPIIIGLSVLLTALVISASGLIYGTETYPLTYQMLEFSGGLFSFFMLIMIVFYSGITVWREKEHKVDELVGASPVKTWVLFLSKFSALCLLCIATLLGSMLTGICIQAWKGYYNFEIALYIKALYGYLFMSFILTSALAAALQVFVNNKFIGYVIMVLISIALPLVLNLGFKLNNPLVDFNSDGSLLPYSDMNGYANNFTQFAYFKLYWIGFILILLSYAFAIYNRGKEKQYSMRMKMAKRSFNGLSKALFIVGTILFLGVGGFIYYNIRVLNPFVSEKQRTKEQVRYERDYSKLLKTPQPRIVESNVVMDIFPDASGYVATGYYYLKNKTKAPISKIYIQMYSEAKVTKMNFDKEFTQFLNDTSVAFRGYELKIPLAPGDSVKFNYVLSEFPKGKVNDSQSTQVVNNGSFINSSILPHIGYAEDFEISDNSERTKKGLKTKERMASLLDSSAYGNNYISNDADWIRFQTVVSTNPDQIAIAPGYLQKEWQQNGRKYYHYKMDAPILNFYSWLSAKYTIKKEIWINPYEKGKDVAIEIYHHSGHPYNVDDMIRGVKKSLDYYVKNFSPYQHKQVRIIEFPRYATFAQSFPNTIPFSESIGFIAKVDRNNPEDVDYPFYVTAHEVAHQWWAHQVIGANVQGSTLMSETMSQYSALMVMEKEYGPHMMHKFLKYEMNNYLRGRVTENKKELPLLLSENQQYLHYNKGSVVMYALKDYIGEDSLNKAMRNYIEKVAYQEPPYTTSLEFIDEIRKVTPDSMKYIINDLFETITVYENKVSAFSVTPIVGGKYKVKMEVSAKKFQSDSVGKQQEIKINDWVDIAVFGKRDPDDKRPEVPLFIKKVKLNKASQTFEFILDKAPERGGIDPYHKLIDRDPDDNIQKQGVFSTPSKNKDEGRVVKVKIGG